MNKGIISRKGLVADSRKPIEPKLSQKTLIINKTILIEDKSLDSLLNSIPPGIAHRDVYFRTESYYDGHLFAPDHYSIIACYNVVEPNINYEKEMQLYNKQMELYKQELALFKETLKIEKLKRNLK